MKSPSSRLLAVMLALVVFGVGLSLFYSASAKRSPQPSKGFVVTFSVTNAQAGETPALEEIQTKFVQASGNWKQVSYFINRGESLTEGASQGVVFSLGKNSLDFAGLSGAAERDEAFRSATFHKTHPEFAGMDSVAGLPTFVHLAEGNGTSVKTYFALDTGITPLKIVVRNSSGFEMVTEALSVQFRDVRDEEVVLPPKPVSFDKAQGRTSALPPESARFLSEQIAEAKQRLNLVR
jgi:hypothetical protein